MTVKSEFLLTSGRGCTHCLKRVSELEDMCMKALSGWLVVEHAWHECGGELGFQILYQGPDEALARDAAEEALGRGARRVHLMRFTRDPGARYVHADFSAAGLRASLLTSRNVRPGSRLISRKRLRHLARRERARGLVG